MNTDNSHFNVITKGIGYINDARVIEPEGAASYLACRLSLLEGHQDAVRYVYVDCIVRGPEAIDLVTQFRSQICSEKHRVIAAVDLGSLRVKPFLYQKGPKQGQPGAALKASLLKISYLKIDEDVLITSEGRAVWLDAEDESDPQPSVVRLSRDDPDFETRKAELKEQGYRWDRAQTAWVQAA